MSSQSIHNQTGASAPAAGKPSAGLGWLAAFPLGPVAALAIRVVAAALAYLLQILLARGLGAAEYGIFNLAWSLVTIGGFLATLGFGQIAVRFLAEYHERNQPALAHGFIRHAFIATLVGSLALSAIVVGFLVRAAPGPGPIVLMILGLVTLPFFAFTDLGEGFARSQGWTMRALVPAYLVRNGVLVAAVALLAGLGMALDARITMFLALIATIGAAALQFFWTMPPLREAFPPTPRTSDSRAWNRAAFPTLLSDLALLARQNIDLLILGLLAPPAMVGLYFAATRIASLLGLIEFAIGASFGHRFAREAGNATFNEARRWMRFAGMVAAVALAGTTPLILALFGDSFAGAFWPALVLLASAAVRMALGPLDDLLTMRGFPSEVWRANAIGALVTATLCLLLAGPWQAMGAAIAATSGTLAAGLALVLAYRRVIPAEAVA